MTKFMNNGTRSSMLYSEELSITYISILRRVSPTTHIDNCLFIYLRSIRNIILHARLVFPRHLFFIHIGRYDYITRVSQ